MNTFEFVWDSHDGMFSVFYFVWLKSVLQIEGVQPFQKSCCSDPTAFGYRLLGKTVIGIRPQLHTMLELDK